MSKSLFYAVPVEANDSQLTLIEPSPGLELVLDNPSSPLNTRLYVNGRARYAVVTKANGRDAQQTNVTDLRTNEVIATMMAKTFLSDTVMFPSRFGGKTMKKEQWMHKTKLENGR